MNTEELRRVLDTELSLPSRLGYVALLLAALLMTAVIASLWLTEPILPARTRMGFALMIAIGLSWVIFAVRALTTRRVLLGWHRVVAARMAVAFTAMFVLGALVLGYATGRTAPYAAAMVNLVMLIAASALLVRANRGFARLTARRCALERELGDKLQYPPRRVEL